MGTFPLFADLYQLDSLTIEKHKKIIANDRDNTKRLESFMKLCRHYVETMHPDVNVLLSDAILLAKQLNNQKALVEAYLLYSRYYYQHGDIEESTVKIKEALIANENLKNNKYFAEIYLQLGENYRVAGALDLAFDHFKISMDYAKKINDSILITAIYNKYSTYYFENLELLPEISRDSSYYYCKLSLDLSLKNLDHNLIITNYNLMGLIYRYKFDKLDTSFVYFMTSYQYALNFNHRRQIPIIAYNIARYFLTKKELDSAKLYIDLGYKIADSLNIKEPKLLFYQLYFNYYSLINDHKNAFDYLLLYVENYKASVEKKTSFKVKSTLSEIQYIKQLIEIEKQEQTRKFLLTIAFMVIIFFGFVMFVLYQRNKHMSKANKKLIEQNELIEKNMRELDEHNKIIKEQNIMLEETNAAKDKLFSIISHDLKNPISGLKDMICALADNYASFSEEEKKEIMHELKNSSESVLDLLMGLLTWSRSQRNKIDYDPHYQDFYQLVYQNIAIVSTMAKNKNITIINHVPENTIAYFDANLINTVVRNLLTNAIKFTPQGGKIEIYAKPYESDPNFIHISISDTGVGIPKDKLDKLFQIKHSFSTLGTSGEKGTGLGLLIVWDFVEKNFGKIWVESELGKGTTFHFTLPINEPSLSAIHQNNQ